MLTLEFMRQLDPTKTHFNFVVTGYEPDSPEKLPKFSSVDLAILVFVKPVELPPEELFLVAVGIKVSPVRGDVKHSVILQIWSEARDGKTFRASPPIVSRFAGRIPNTDRGCLQQTFLEKHLKWGASSASTFHRGTQPSGLCLACSLGCQGAPLHLGTSVVLEKMHPFSVLAGKTGERTDCNWPLSVKTVIFAVTD